LYVRAFCPAEQLVSGIAIGAAEPPVAFPNTLSAEIFARDIVPVVVSGLCVEARPVPITMLVTVPVEVMALQPNPVFVVHIRALLAALQDGTDMAVGTAEPDVPLATTVLFAMDGKSPITIPRNAGVAAPPEVGPAQKALALSLAETNVRVPPLVTGDPDTVKIAGAERATDVTVPVPDTVSHAGTPEAFSDRICVPLLFPAKAVQPDAPR
jgi:hypothetical protein